jgi:alcohol dehydrogenase class IV
MEGIELGTKLSGLGIKSENDIETIINNGFNRDRVKNNPRKVTRQALRKILENIY